MSAVAIALHNVSKTFRVPLDRSNTLKRRIVHLKSTGRYRTLNALQDITFDVKSGEFLGIIGNNGSGKSTLLKVVARIYRPTKGEVVISGPVSPFLELGVGFDPELTARENILLNGTILGLTRAELHQKIDGILDFAELHEFADQKVKNFSSGMQVRLAFSVAIQAHAGILLMDEVLAVGDASFQQKCFDVFARYKREGRTVILVTHDLSAVENYCDRAILLDSGKLVADGNATEVTKLYRRRIGEKEAGADASSAVSADASSDGWGDNELTISKVSLLNDSGEAVSVIAHGSAAQIEVEYAAKAGVTLQGSLACELTVRRVDGVLLAAINSAIEGADIATPADGQTVYASYGVKSLPFLGGHYLITAEIRDRHSGHVYHHLEGAMSFRVLDELGRSGYVSLDGEWGSGLKSAATTGQKSSPA